MVRGLVKPEIPVRQQQCSEKGRRRTPFGVDQGGMTLVEVMVAIMIMMMAMAALALVLTNAFASVSLSGQQQQAANLAADALAQYEALPLATLGDGLLAADPTLTADEGVGHDVVSGTGGYCYEGLPLVVGASVPTSCAGTSTTWYNLPALATCSASIAPDVAVPTTTSAGTAYLVHQRCVAVDGTHFEVAVFPTEVTGTSLVQEVQLTVAVSWGSATSLGGGDTHVSDSAVLSCGTTAGLSGSGC